MKIWRNLLVVTAAGLMLWSASASGQTKSVPCDQARARTPEKVEGQIVKIDSAQGRVSVRESNGTTHEFEASKETLQDFKVGDRIDAKLRSLPNC
jgi:hypothetical protein